MLASHRLSAMRRDVEQNPDPWTPAAGRMPLLSKVRRCIVLRSQSDAGFSARQHHSESRPEFPRKVTLEKKTPSLLTAFTAPP